MAKAQRVLTEVEIDEQLRLGIKKEALAIVKNAEPYSKHRIDTVLRSWREVNTQLQIDLAIRRMQMHYLTMLPKDLREKEIIKAASKMLP